MLSRCTAVSQHLPTVGVGIRLLSLILVGTLLSNGSSEAMDFRLYYQAELRRNVVIGEGIIEPGDDNRFRAIAKLADRDGNGDVEFVLNSAGGSVAAAFDLVAAMDDVGVYAIVPDNAVCASACASIVYVSAPHHVVVGTGRLGFHSCYTNKDGLVHESALCNDLIAQNAMERGLSHAAVMLFVDDYGPRDMAWIGKDVACMIGLCRPPSTPPEPVTKSGELSSGAGEPIFGKPSFNCENATSATEVAICRDSSLAALDQELGQVYATRLARPDTQKSVLRLEQRRWIRERDGLCGGDIDCLSGAIRERIETLR